MRFDEDYIIYADVGKNPIRFEWDKGYMILNMTEYFPVSQGVMKKICKIITEDTYEHITENVAKMLDFFQNSLIPAYQNVVRINESRRDEWEKTLIRTSENNVISNVKRQIQAHNSTIKYYNKRIDLIRKNIEIIEQSLSYYIDSGR